MSHIYTQADYYAMEAQFLRYPDNRRMVNYKGPEFPGTLEGTEPPISIKCLHPSYLRRKAFGRAQQILPRTTIDVNSKVLVFGCGFGHLIEAITQIVGCPCVGVDPSQYVQDVKGLSPDGWLNDGIIAGGLDPAVGNGLKIATDFADPNPISTATIYQLDVAKNGERRSLERDFGIPTHVITEEVWQILSAQEISDYSAVFTTWGSEVTHYIDGRVQ